MSNWIDKTILIISPEDWEHNFVSKHHYAIELSKRGNTVFFLNPPGKINSVKTQDGSNVQVIDYQPIFRGLNRLPSWLSKYFWKMETNRILRHTGKIDVVFTFDPFRFQFVRLFAPWKAIYYMADFHHTTCETMLASQVDLIVGPSEILLNRIRASVPKVKLNHAVSLDFFNRDVTSLPGNNKIKVGFSGNLESRYMHRELFKSAIQKNPDLDFILAGNSNGAFAKELGVFENVYMLGRLTGRELAGMIRSCDILMICYDTDRFWSEASNAHKIMEYLASGRVVVSTRMAEYINSHELIKMPNENSNFVELLTAIKTELSFYNSPEQQQVRIEYARLNTYSAQMDRIEGLIAPS